MVEHLLCVQLCFSFPFSFQFFTRLAAVFAEEVSDSEYKLGFVIFVVFGDVFFMISHIKKYNYQIAKKYYQVVVPVIHGGKLHH